MLSVVCLRPQTPHIRGLMMLGCDAGGVSDGFPLYLVAASSGTQNAGRRRYPTGLLGFDNAPARCAKPRSGVEAAGEAVGGRTEGRRTRGRYRGGPPGRRRPIRCRMRRRGAQKSGRMGSAGPGPFTGGGPASRQRGRPQADRGRPRRRLERMKISPSRLRPRSRARGGPSPTLRLPS